MTGSCEYGNESSGPIKYREFFFLLDDKILTS